MTIIMLKIIPDIQLIYRDAINQRGIIGKPSFALMVAGIDISKTIKIITEVIPNSYWKKNAETDN